MKDIYDVIQEWEELQDHIDDYCFGRERLDEALFKEAMLDAYMYFNNALDFEKYEDQYSLLIGGVELYGIIYAYSRALSLDSEGTIAFNASQTVAELLCDGITMRCYFPKDTGIFKRECFSVVEGDEIIEERILYDVNVGDLSSVIEWISH